MFGYVTPDKPYLTLRDFALYRSVYCGICCSLKKNYGQISRLATTYDAVFLSLLLHNYLDSDYAIEKKRCILHPIKKRTIAQPNEIDDVVCAFNLLLMYHKIAQHLPVPLSAALGQRRQQAGGIGLQPVGDPRRALGISA